MAFVAKLVHDLHTSPACPPCEYGTTSKDMCLIRECKTNSNLFTVHVVNISFKTSLLVLNGNHGANITKCRLIM